jgi:XapX domain-containing protein
MTGYVVSLVMGVAVGVAYGFVQVRSPAPPLIALVGLFGMVLGQHAIVAARHRFAPTSTSVQQARGDVQTPPDHAAATSVMQTLHRDGHAALVADVAPSVRFEKRRFGSARTLRW